MTDSASPAARTSPLAPLPRSTTGVIVLTSEAVLVEHTLRACAAAHVDPMVLAPSAASPPPRPRADDWRRAPAVVIGADLAVAVAAWSLPRREDVWLVAPDPDGADSVALWRAAVDLHADQVIRLPSQEAALARRLAALADGGAAAATVGIVGGRGGAGASTLAAALSLHAAGTPRRVMLVDADPCGGGAELAVGCESVDGLRWADIEQAGQLLHGQVRGEALRTALPRRDRLAVLSWRRGSGGLLRAETMQAMIGAGQRGSDLVVIDLPRRLDPAADVALAACHSLLVVVPADVRSVAATQTLLSRLDGARPATRLVVRTFRGAVLGPGAIADAVGAPVLATVPTHRALRRSVDDGFGPLAGTISGRALRRACAAILATATAGPAASTGPVTAGVAGRA